MFEGNNKIIRNRVIISNKYLSILKVVIFISPFLLQSFFTLMQHAGTQNTNINTMTQPSAKHIDSSMSPAPANNSPFTFLRPNAHPSSQCLDWSCPVRCGYHWLLHYLPPSARPLPSRFESIPLLTFYCHRPAAFGTNKHNLPLEARKGEYYWQSNAVFTITLLTNLMYFHFATPNLLRRRNQILHYLPTATDRLYFLTKTNSYWFWELRRG